MRNTPDFILMQVMFTTEIGATIGVIAVASMMRTAFLDHRALSGSDVSARVDFQCTAMIVAASLNLITAGVAGFYFSRIAKELMPLMAPRSESKLTLIKESADCHRPSLFTAPAEHRNRAMITALVILGSALGLLALAFEVGIVATLRWHIVDAHTYEVESSFLVERSREEHGLLSASVVALIAKVACVYIGHTWAVLRTQCLKERMA